MNGTELTENETPRELLLEIYQSRRSRNPSYSMRAFARDLGVSQAFVSQVLNGKRRLALKRAVQFSMTLGLADSECQPLLESVARESGNDPVAQSYLDQLLSRRRPSRAPAALQSQRLEADRFRSISQWYHAAILDLTTTRSFKSDIRWIARRIGITATEARDAVQRLVRLGLLEERDGVLVKTTLHLTVPTENSKSAVRQFHRQMIGKALDELEATDDQAFARRKISGTTMAVNSARISEARRRVDEFQRELAAFLTEGECDELYQVNVQLFPLTKAGETK